MLERWITAEFADRLGLVFETMIGSRPAIECQASEPAAAGRNTEELVIEQRLSGIPGGIVWVAARQESWQLIGSEILKAAGLEETDVEDSRSTFLETIGQTTSGLCQALSARLRREVSCAPAIEVATQPMDASWTRLEIGLDAGLTVIRVGLTADVIDSIAVQSVGVAPVNTEVKPEVLGPAGVGGEPQTLDLLFDVELPVSVSFGRAQLPLKDIIKLTTGSIVELNRAISEPVEIIVNNCVIARGEVVVVEGNFGVRIQQVVSRQERLRTLT